jgi:type III restriction enzyme
MSEPEREATRVTLEVIREFEGLKSSAELSRPEQQEKLVERVRAVLTAQAAKAAAAGAGGTAVQVPLPGARVEPAVPANLDAVVARATKTFEELTIDIPRITVTPIDGKSGYTDFDLDLSSVACQPSADGIYIQNLHDGRSSVLVGWDTGAAEAQFEDYLVRSLVDYPDISYDSTAELLYKLAGQTVAHLRSYLPDEDAVENVVRGFQKQLVGLIHAQMQEHFEETASGYHVKVSKGFSELKTDHYPVNGAEPVRDFRDPVPNKQGIRQLLFGGFEKCLYGKQRFDVDAERLLSVILEKDNDVLKWYKPGRNDFQIYYSNESAYEPDFVVETRAGKYLCEPKRAADLEEKQVQEKARAARRWCEKANTVSEKPWKYLLIPHDWIQENRTFGFFAGNCG